MAKDKKSPIHITLFAFFLSYALWSFFYAFMSSSHSKEVAWVYIKLFSFSYTVSAAFLFHFCTLFAKKNGKNFQVLVILNYLVGITFWIKGSINPFLFDDLVRVNGFWLEINNTDSLWALFYTLYYYLSIIGGVTILIKCCWNSPELKIKKQIRIIVTCYIITMIFTIFNNFIQQMIFPGISPRMPHLVTLILIGGVSYAILKLDFLNHAHSSLSNNKYWKRLSKREKEVSLLLIQGLTYKEVSLKLCIAQNTVKSHVDNIFSKTETNSRTKLPGILAPTLNIPFENSEISRKSA
ncbi:MAG: hypothetical protein HQK83_08905 [Fibrobacteria bacterium]|nr:hypothetical protein [Fibrobacteria bacterium]